MEVTVKLNGIRRSPTKIRPTLYLVRGKNALAALDILKFTNKGCAIEVYKLIKSGIAAAGEREMKSDSLYVKEIKCDGAGMYKRHRYGSRGKVVRIVKRNSHLTVTLSDEIKAANKKEDAKEAVKAEPVITEEKPKAEVAEAEEKKVTKKVTSK